MKMILKSEHVSFFLGFFVMCSFLFVIFFAFGHSYKKNDTQIANVKKKDILNTPIERKELVIGNVGNDVIEVQERLKAFHVLEIEEFDEDEEGFFGEQTQYYVTLFQISQDIVPHGRVDSVTWKRLIDPRIVSQNYIDQIRNSLVLGSGFDKDDIYYAAQFQKITFLTFRGIDSVSYQKKIDSLLQMHDAQAAYFVSPEHLHKFDKSISSDKTVFGIYIKDLEDLRKIILTQYDLSCAQPSYDMITPQHINGIRTAGFQLMQWNVDPQNAHNVITDMAFDHLYRYTQHYDLVSFDVSDESDQSFLVLLEKYLQKMNEENWIVRAPLCGQ
jgi:hypothetical protein